MRILTLILLMLIQFTANGQVSTTKTKPDEVRLLFSDTISDCSCKGIFNAVKLNDIKKLNTCLLMGADFECRLKHYESYRYGIFNHNTDYHTFEIMPHDYAKMISNDEVLKLFKSHNIWSMETSEKVMESMYQIMTDIRYNDISTNILDSLFEEIGDRILFTDRLTVIDNWRTTSTRNIYTRPCHIINHSTDLNIPRIYKYFYENYSMNSDELCIANGMVLRHCQYPTVEYFEYFLGKKIISENDLKQFCNKEFKWFRKPNGNTDKLVRSYYKNYFKIDSSTPTKKQEMIKNKMNRIREKLAKKNELKYNI